MRDGVALLLLTRRIAAPARELAKAQCTRYPLHLTRTACQSWSTVQRWSSTAARKWSTPLAKTIADAIEGEQTTGPISIAAYMRQCLTSPQGGYYTTTRVRPDDSSAPADPFGRKGDFITSPEISQVFGELVGVWFVSEWMAQGRKSSGIQLIEMGPGRGTLMDDMLRTIASFKPFAKALEAVYLVEASEQLRRKQCDLLCGVGSKMSDEEDGSFRCVSKYAGLPVVWVEDISLLPVEDAAAEKTPFIVAHEFFDALPIHAFESVAPLASTSSPQQPEMLSTPTGPIARSSSSNSSSASQTPQWRELLVVPSVKKTILRKQGEAEKDESDSSSQPDFQLTLAKASNPSSLVLPESSERYKRLKSQPGSTIEVSPESYRYVQDFARRIGGTSTSTSTSRKNPSNAPPHTKPLPSGAALIIDYGPSTTIPINSLRGIRAHTRVSPFLHPGEVDISADVDFTALAEAALLASPGVEVHGPVEQGFWLLTMGIRERVEMLVIGVGGSGGDGIEEGERKKRDLETGWKRLVDRSSGMGSVYKVMALVPENGGRRRPVGLGGGVDV